MLNDVFLVIEKQNVERIYFGPFPQWFIIDKNGFRITHHKTHSGQLASTILEADPGYTL